MIPFFIGSVIWYLPCRIIVQVYRIRAKKTMMVTRTVMLVMKTTITIWFLIIRLQMLLWINFNLFYLISIPDAFDIAFLSIMPEACHTWVAFSISVPSYKFSSVPITKNLIVKSEGLSIQKSEFFVDFCLLMANFNIFLCWTIFFFFHHRITVFLWIILTKKTLIRMAWGTNVITVWLFITQTRQTLTGMVMETRVMMIKMEMVNINRTVYYDSKVRTWWNWKSSIKSRSLALYW